MQGNVSTIQNLEDTARGLQHGKGFREFLKGVVHQSRDEGIISGMKDTLAAAIQMFQVHPVLEIWQARELIF